MAKAREKLAKAESKVDTVLGKLVENKYTVAILAVAVLATMGFAFVLLT